ncbi:MAG: acyl carrier protein [bacterium]|nr:acyl carrier protein [bacterium]
MMKEIEKQIKDFIFENFLIGQSTRDLKNDVSFLDEGIIDSTGMLELVAFIENTYGIVVEDEELIPENLDSINRIIAYLERKGCLFAKLRG